MRVATFVLGVALAMTGGTSEASDSADGPSKSVHSTASFAEGVFAVPTTSRFIAPNASASSNAQQGNLRNGAGGAMGFVPSQSPALLTRSRSTLAERATQPQSRPYHPANVPLPATRTLEDHLLTGLVALMLIAYQLRRKHRFLRPHQFSI